MKRSIRWTLLAAVFAALALFVAACGGDDDEGGGTAGGGEQQQPTEGEKGGKVTYLWASDIDYLDPGQTYYTVGYVVGTATNRSLYNYKPEDATKPIPDLAEGDPQISSDNKTITVKIRSGVKYAPPVNREVKAQDVKYAIERAFTKQVPSGYAGTYFNSIVGTPEESNTGSYKPISGLTTPDDRTLVIKLKTPSAALVSQALVMPITTPVPKEYAQKFDRNNPTTYEQYVAFTGPYMVKNDPQTGKVTGRVPGKQIQLVRNPNWDAKTDFRPAYLDEIQIDQGNDDTVVASRRTLQGNATICCDGSPPATILKQALTRNKEQILFVPSGGTRYISMNTTVKPFDNINIRKAIIAGMDRNALRLTRGGEAIGDIANGWMPPGIPGFEEAGGLKQNTDLDFYAKEEGDMAVFKKYMLAAKQEDPSLPIDDATGKWTGDEKFLTIADNADPGKKTAEVFQGQMNEMGFQLNFRIVPQDTLYTKFLGRPDVNVALGPNVGWFKDFTDPQSMLDATFNGDNILEQGNVNWPELDVPAINNAMKEAATVEVGPERNEAWAKINRQIAEQAPAIPWVWDKQGNLMSEDVNGVTNGVSTLFDLSYTSLKK